VNPARFDAAQANELISLLIDAVDVSGRLDPLRLDELVDELERYPFDVAATAMVVVLARRLGSAPGALLLAVQADVAPATTLLRRTVGQLFFLAAQQLADGESPDAPLVAMQAMRREVGPHQLLHGGLWALTVAERCRTGRG
jgi:hypothetical protein